LAFDTAAGETWTTAICNGDVSCTWEDTIPGRLIAGVSDSPNLVATDTTHTQPTEKRMVTSIKPGARALTGHQCAVAQSSSTLANIVSGDCICVCKA
jgi:hypothetical protein